MTERSTAHRLAAIVAADMEGYSRLTEADEAGTLSRQRAYLREIIEPSFRLHRGRTFKTTGDGFIAEFASIVDAVRCALAIQEAIAQRERTVPAPTRIRYRMGINLGDIIAEADTIFGDGVNIAARLEKLAEPGGIAVSGTVYDEIENKLPLNCEYIGEHTVKNIQKPIRVYRVNWLLPK